MRIPASLVLALVTSVGGAQVVVAPALPVVGSSNPVSAEPAIVRPGTTPCVVPLLQEQKFGDYSGKPFSYTPPAGCPGPWAKVVFTADFTVTAGRQFDRTAQFYLGNANIYYGTTAEPRAALSPSWHVERDLTDLSALLLSPQVGQAEVFNVVDGTYTGVIYGNASLAFYPASKKYPAAVVPDVVVPFGSTNDSYTLNTTADQATKTVNLPRNVEKVYLDVIAQSQSNDEFWYLCVPNDQAGALESCGNTGFRETEVTIDGKPAGVAPVFPWIYTGGIDPYLWEPVTGVQTLNFKPYRVDLTPFAGVLGDGSAHTVGVSVYNANSYFLATANLLVYTDHGKTVVKGGLLSNSLGAEPTPLVNENLKTDASGTTTGTVTVSSGRTFTVLGYVETSHGRVETRIDQNVKFENAQTVDVNASNGVPDVQNVVQTSSVGTTTVTRSGGRIVDIENTSVSYPLVLNYSFLGNADGSYTQVVNSTQTNLEFATSDKQGAHVVASELLEEVQSSDTLQYTASFGLKAAGVGSATAVYYSKDTAGNCVSRSLTAANQKLTSVVDGEGCPVKK